MSSPSDDQKTLSAADPNRLGATPSNPIMDSSVINNPTAERFIVYNPAHGFYSVTAQMARMWRGYGYAIMDSYGNRVNDFDSELNAVIAVHAESDRYDTFNHQEEEIWELLDMKAAMAELGADERIIWDFKAKRFRRLKKDNKAVTSKKGKDNSKGNDPGSPGTGAASSSTPVIAN